MPDMSTPPGSLVLYRNRPARVIHVGDRLEIELEEGKTLKVRPKDIVMLHPGPLQHLSHLQPPAGDVQTAWELLAGSTTTLAELAELAYGDYTPAAAWASWQLVSEGLYFRGTPEAVEVATAEEVTRLQEARAAKAMEDRAWNEFMGRLRTGHTQPQDERYLHEIEALAYGHRTTSRALRELGRVENPQKAHALLLRLKYWDESVDPYPQRLNVPTVPPTIHLSALPEEIRRDLTHLQAFAIDDKGNQDPDDALSLEDHRLWVHVADVAALVPPASAADLEARTRGANLYLPEGTVPMLPPHATHVLGLGLAEVSPALSFGLNISATGEVLCMEIVPSWVRVTRLTYDEVETRLDQAPFTHLYCLTQRYAARRQANGAVSIALPEIKVLVQHGQVLLQPLLPLKSRALVQEAMLMAGEAIASYALARGIPLPFTIQDPPEATERPDGMAGMYALRRTMKRSQQTGTPGPHAGLGLAAYTRVTSPLRRYLDLVVHQQLRAHLRGTTLLDEQGVLARVGAAEAVTGNVRQAELLASRHWTMVYLVQHPDWSGVGVLVEKRDRRGIILIPELGLETRLPVPDTLALNDTVPLVLNGVNIAELEAYFRLPA